MITLMILILLFLAMIISLMKVFDKAGQPAWAAIIPIYNVMVLAEIAGKSKLYGLGLLIPILGIFFWVRICVGVAKQFGYGGAIGALCFFHFGWLIVGFSGAQYRGRSANSEQTEFVSQS